MPAPRLGGQYWRHRAGDDGARHHDWAAFLPAARPPWRRRSRPGRSSTSPRSRCGTLTREPDGFVVHGLDGDRAREVRARTVVLATGAYDRQLPFPGWTLPGVYTAGAAQALLKGHGVVVGRRIVVAGTGPFLLPVATGLAAAGATVVGVFEAGRPTGVRPPPADDAAEHVEAPRGRGLPPRRCAPAACPYRTRSTVVEALGEDAVTGVRVARLDAAWRIVPGSEQELECDAVAVGYGFTPQPELALQLGCEHVLDRDGSLVATVDDDQASTVAGVFVAGEATGVGGADLSLAEGEIAGFAAAASALGRAVDRAATRRARGRRHRGRAFAAGAARGVPGAARLARLADADDTIVCRCEEVTAGRVGRGDGRPRRHGRPDRQAARAARAWACARAASAATRRRASSPIGPAGRSRRRTSPASPHGPIAAARPARRARGRRRREADPLRDAQYHVTLH